MSSCNFAGNDLFGHADDIADLILQRRKNYGIPPDSVIDAVIRDTARSTVQECVNILRKIGEL